MSSSPTASNHRSDQPKVLIICGPTASGKTDVALTLTKKFPGEIISADSRQVYINMDIGTGKDIPPGANKETRSLGKNTYVTYKTSHTRIWGYDLIPPDQEISIATYHRFMNPIVQNLIDRNILPIIIGGSGLFINSLIDPPDTMSIPPNPQLRRKLGQYSLEELQRHLRQTDPPKWAHMNRSDRSNPRRLIRALEIAAHPPTSLMPIPDYHLLTLGLSLPKKELDCRIKTRVLQRIDQGFDQEVKHILKTYSPLSPQACSSLGYAQWLSYLEGKLSQEEAINRWITQEQQYAKRQITWFNKQPNIRWIEPTKAAHPTVERLVKTWYST